MAWVSWKREKVWLKGRSAYHRAVRRLALGARTGKVLSVYYKAACGATTYSPWGSRIVDEDDLAALGREMECKRCVRVVNPEHELE